MEATRIYFLLLAVITISTIATALVQQRQCSSQTQCHSNECCVTDDNHRGRRSLSGHEAGHCVAMGTKGGDCYVLSNNEPKPPSGVVSSCPCELHCVGNGMIEVALGELGTCE